jgi:hypothetical protein
MTFTLDITEIFGNADAIINALLPVVYVVAGIGLGFVVVNRIISAFR